MPDWLGYESAPRAAPKRKAEAAAAGDAGRRGGKSSVGVSQPGGKKKRRGSKEGAGKRKSEEGERENEEAEEEEEEEEEEGCCICLDPLSPAADGGEATSVLRCNHTLHTRCVNDVAAKAARVSPPTRAGVLILCPLCRPCPHEVATVCSPSAAAAASRDQRTSAHVVPRAAQQYSVQYGGAVRGASVAQLLRPPQATITQ